MRARAAANHIKLDITATDAAGNPIEPSTGEMLAALLKGLESVMPRLEAPQQVAFAQGVAKIFTPVAAKATDVGTLHVPIRGEHGEVVAMLDLTGAKAAAYLREIGASWEKPDGSTGTFEDL
jgi:hypothetical protein